MTTLDLKTLLKNTCIKFVSKTETVIFQDEDMVYKNGATVPYSVYEREAVHYIKIDNVEYEILHLKINIKENTIMKMWLKDRQGNTHEYAEKVAEI